MNLKEKIYIYYLFDDLMCRKSLKLEIHSEELPSNFLNFLQVNGYSLNKTRWRLEKGKREYKII